MDRVKLFIDTDIGDDIDDLQALTLALVSPEVDLVGVTTVWGNTLRRAKLVRKLLEAAGRKDVPVAPGAGSPLLRPGRATAFDGHNLDLGVLEEEQCWGEGLLHGGGLMEDWPLWAQDRIEFLTGALGGDQGRTVLTICPHCRDTIRTQYQAFGGRFTDVRLHTPYLAALVEAGDLELETRPQEVAIHTPCKVFHNDEHREMSDLLRGVGLTLRQPATSSAAFPTTCCGGGGGGFLWDSPAKVNQKRWEQIRATGLKEVVTGCPGCHRMLGVMRDEDARISDVATVLAERLKA